MPKTPFDKQKSARARRSGREHAGTFLYWFRDRYKMPPNDPRYLALTGEEIEADYWAWHYFNNPKADSFESDEWDSDALLEAMASDDWEQVI